MLSYLIIQRIYFQAYCSKIKSIVKYEKNESGAEDAQFQEDND